MDGTVPGTWYQVLILKISVPVPRSRPSSKYSSFFYFFLLLYFLLFFCGCFVCVVCGGDFVYTMMLKI